VSDGVEVSLGDFFSYHIEGFTLQPCYFPCVFDIIGLHNVLTFCQAQLVYKTEVCSE